MADFRLKSGVKSFGIGYSIIQQIGVEKNNHVQPLYYANQYCIYLLSSAAVMRSFSILYLSIRFRRFVSTMFSNRLYISYAYLYSFNPHNIFVNIFLVIFNKCVSTSNPCSSTLEYCEGLGSPPQRPN